MLEGLVIPFPDLFAADKFSHHGYFSHAILHQDHPPEQMKIVMAALAKMQVRNNVRSVGEFTPTMRAALHVEMLTFDPYIKKLDTSRSTKDWSLLMLRQGASSFLEYNRARSSLVDN